MQIDVFNGDADGVCALLQLRLAQPMQSQLVTGVKRDIHLLEAVEAQQGDSITVLDISFDKNKTSVERLLNQQAHIFYVDHHQANQLFQHHHLKTLINTDANTCTSLLINEYLEGKYTAWAVTAAFGDNLYQSAEKTALSLSLSTEQLQQLKMLGICINYNGYGSHLADLHFAPDLLYRELADYQSPFDFIHDNPVMYEKLLSGYSEDIYLAEQLSPEYDNDHISVYMLPDEIWSRRVSGVFGNALANKYPDKAHAVISCNDKQAYQVSVRAPLNRKIKADELCSTFPTGGGRKAAAGINHLATHELELFIARFEQTYA